MHHGQVAGLTDLGDHTTQDDAALGRGGVVAQDVETEARQPLTHRVGPPVRLAGQQPGLFEQGEGAVQAGLGEFGGLHELRQGHRSAHPHQDFEDPEGLEGGGRLVGDIRGFAPERDDLSCHDSTPVRWAARLFSSARR
jgi:hypothetical protein